MIKIVTDSSVDLPPEIVRELDISVVPLSIHFGDKTYIDGEDIDAATFYRMLKTETAHPRTAQPPAGRFEQVYQTLAAAGHQIVAITLAATLSGTFNSASLAARNLPEAHVTVIDSGTVTMAMGSLVIRAARMGREGATVEEITSTVHDMMPRLNVCLMVETLTYLQRGGRIGRASSLAGTLLNIKPIITLRDGVVTPLKRVRTHSKAVQEMVGLAAEQQPIEEMYVMHTGVPDEAAEFAAMLQPLYDGRGVPALPLGPVVGVHIGPGCLGVATLRGNASRGG